MNFDDMAARITKIQAAHDASSTPAGEDVQRVGELLAILNELLRQHERARHIIKVRLGWTDEELDGAFTGQQPSIPEGLPSAGQSEHWLVKAARATADTAEVRRELDELRARAEKAEQELAKFLDEHKKDGEIMAGNVMRMARARNEAMEEVHRQAVRAQNAEHRAVTAEAKAGRLALRLTDAQQVLIDENNAHWKRMNDLHSEIATRDAKIERLMAELQRRQEAGEAVTPRQLGTQPLGVFCSQCPNEIPCPDHGPKAVPRWRRVLRKLIVDGVVTESEQRMHAALWPLEELISVLESGKGAAGLPQGVVDLLPLWKLETYTLHSKDQTSGHELAVLRIGGYGPTVRPRVELRDAINAYGDALAGRVQ